MGAVIFDFWGTLVNGGARSPLRRTHRILAKEGDFGEFVEKFESITMVKTFESQQEMFEHAAKEMGYEANAETIEALIGVWNKNALLAEPFDDALPTLETLKEKGIKMALLSNTASFLTEEVIERLKLNDFFDVIALSYKEGMLKTDPKMIKKIMKELGSTKDDTILVGDSVETDMKAAEASKLKGILIDRRGRREYDNKINVLGQVLDEL
ncbi:MAG: HAD family hydrolase [Candidatus Woesearchaeota archaeon]|jgi:putative hydrolase of the HAD superfamily|nr:HAD family hydrolase [Candidatus Woesearchaeota archaeon]MDP7198195.1 HAD family hydrolase [Candidatus Woesearchaeota archaeon]MDP7467031.1 HAD family hydrolase [Candidatus Woesearchaeota archaeon]MDP7646700.1 HAD family hydrolase [Candidatus Woesearchaeota archaeon]